MVSPVRGDHRRFQAETPLIDLFKFAEPALKYDQRFAKSRAIENQSIFIREASDRFPVV